MDISFDALGNTGFPAEITENRSQNGIEIDVSKLDLNGLRNVKSRLYSMFESANRLNIKLVVDNLETIKPVQSNCHHLMESCLRDSNIRTELYTALKCLTSSSSGSRQFHISLANQ